MMVGERIARLGVNIDHFATLRQLRGTPYPNLVEVAQAVVAAGAQQITVHLREDRRHIQDGDVRDLKKNLRGASLNLEMATDPGITRFALKVRPDWVCIVPERRFEVTTEGGLDLKRGKKRLAETIIQLKKAKICVSLFVEPSLEAMRQAAEFGADAVELHTGRYCLASQGAFGARSRAMEKKELDRIALAGLEAVKCGLAVHAGHGFDLSNVRPVAAMCRPGGEVLIEEFNIGHYLVCRAALVGLKGAVREMIAAVGAP